MSPSLAELRQVMWRRPDGSSLWESPLSATFGGERIGLVGPNGIGKSVLLQLLLGTLEPAAGVVHRTGRWHAVAQQAVIESRCSVAALAGLEPPLQALRRLERGDGTDEDLQLASGHWTLADDLRHALHEAGWQGDDLLAASGPLSDGLRMRIALAGAWFAQADALVLDEPTNHLDRGGRDALVARLRRWSGTLIVASHDRGLLREMDRIVEVSARGLQAFGGNFDAYATQRRAEKEAAEAALAHARAHRDGVLRELRRRHDAQQQRLTRGRARAREANLPRMVIKGMQAQAEHTDARLRRLGADQRSAAQAAVTAAALRVPVDPTAALALPGSQVEPAQRVLDVDGLRCAWQPRGLAALSLSLQGPRRVALTGPNGCGKTTLLRTLCGELPPAAGAAILHLPFAWLDQRAIAALPGGGTAIAHLQSLESGLSGSDLRTRLARLGLTAQVLEAPAAGLSGGERMRVALAATLWRKQPPRVLLLDEPTNHLDLAATESLEEALADFPGAIIVSSHDAGFIAALDCDVSWTWRSEGWLVEN